MLDYYEFINETKMTSEKDGKDLELNDKGKKLPPFEYYYQDQLDDNLYYVLKFINIDDYEPTNNKVTLLNNSLWQDTDIANRKNEIIRNTDFSDNDYYFYKLVSTPRRIREIHGVNIPYIKEPDRFNDQLTQDNRLHFVVIEKNSTVTNVRLNAGQRTASGIKAEVIIKDKFGWEMERTGISKTLSTGNNLAKFSDILKTDMGILNEYEDLFNLVDTNSPLNKHDLIITSGVHRGQKIEVKKYDVIDMFYMDNRPKSLMMSEQFKIGDKRGLRKLVMLYKEMNPDVDVEPLIGDFDQDGGVKLNMLFRKTGENRPHRELVQNIRDFYNERIDYMIRKYQRLDNELIMNDVYGVYFFSTETGVDGFLIKTNKDEKKERNINYYWETDESQWGLNRIKLLFNVKPNAYRYVWLGDEELFVRTFVVSNRRKLKELKIVDIKTAHNPIIKDTDVGPIKWDSTKGYWVRIDNNHELLRNGVHMVLDNPSKSQNR